MQEKLEKLEKFTHIETVHDRKNLAIVQNVATGFQKNNFRLSTGL